MAVVCQQLWVESFCRKNGKDSKEIENQQKYWEWESENERVQGKAKKKGIKKARYMRSVDKERKLQEIKNGEP